MKWDAWLEQVITGRPELLIKARKPKVPEAQMGFAFDAPAAKPAEKPKPAAPKPPAGGWQPIPGGKHGGQRRRKGNRWEYRYPDGKGGWGSSPPKPKGKGKTLVVKPEAPEDKPGEKPAAPVEDWSAAGDQPTGIQAGIKEVHSYVSRGATVSDALDMYREEHPDVTDEELAQIGEVAHQAVWGGKPKAAAPAPGKKKPAAKKPRAAAKPKEPKEPKPKERQFEDWGEHVPGSRKELAAERAKLASVSQDELEKNPGWARKMVTRNNIVGIWGEEQAAEDKKNGLQPRTSALKKMVLEHIAHKPPDNAEMRQAYREACKIVVNSLGNCKTQEDVWTFMDEWKAAARGPRGRADMLEGEREAAVRKSNRYQEMTEALGRRFASIAGMRLTKGRWGSMLSFYYEGARTKDRRKLDAELGKVTDWSFAEKKKAATKPKGDKIGVEEANEGVVFWSRKIGAVERKGLAAVGNPEDSGAFAKSVGFRAVQYGEWADDSDREWHVTNAFWGLHDLATVLGIPSGQLGVNGRLALAFGARGKGGKGAGVAHYEPAQRIINITKMKGSGSLAHEFGHFLDHVQFMQQNPKVGRTKYASESPGDAFVEIGEAMTKVMDVVKSFGAEVDKIKRAEQRVKLRETMDRTREAIDAKRKELKQIDRLKSKIMRTEGYSRSDWSEETKERLENLSEQADRIRTEHNDLIPTYNDALHAWKESFKPPVSDFYKSAQGLDDTQKRKKPYWATDRELFARMFESYVEDKLHERKARSSYLVDGTRADYPTFPGMYIPADSAHRKAVNAAMDELIKRIRMYDGFTKSLGAFLG